MATTLSGRVTTGTLVVLVGVLLLLATTGTIETASLWAWMPAIFVGLGVWALVASGFRNLTGPIMVIAVAGTYLGHTLGVVPDSVLARWWPAFLVLFGVLLVVGRSRRRDYARSRGSDAGGERTVLAVFGGSERRVTTDRFTGAELLALFGGVELDLRDAGVRHRPAVIETFAAFGGVELAVPREWQVEVEVLPIFGGVEDVRARTTASDAGGSGRSETSDRPGTSARSGDEPDLVVTGLVLFGGVEIRD